MSADEPTTKQSKAEDIPRPTDEEIRRWREDSDVLRHANIIEIAVRNEAGSVSEYMNHWEGRALKAEAALAGDAGAAPPPLQKLAKKLGLEAEALIGVRTRGQYDRGFIDGRIDAYRASEKIVIQVLEDSRGGAAHAAAPRPDLLTMLEAFQALADSWRSIASGAAHQKGEHFGIEAMRQCAKDLDGLIAIGNAAYRAGGGAAQAAAPRPETLKERQLSWVLDRAEALIRENHGKTAAYCFTEAWTELPKELYTDFAPERGGAVPPAPPSEVK